ncbi:MAG: FecR domain-containing protein [Reyranella sp.]|uniref:FecR family protein n=1 Tax=Reyranella sp. TaxID=1929291 RepID=UPI001ACCFDBD|nr:FecR domain-containing protein [Reyranella sp.]MBN9086200.1 FecR domain-containing protein [Reyranella sp.]
MEWRSQSFFTRLLTLLLSTAAPLTQAAAQSFAKVGAVNPDTTGTPPGGSARTLVVGTDVVVRETIRTSASGSSHILFPDQSTVNIGPNSELVLDEYVYDPNAKSGRMRASVFKGVLRYVGGQISHNSEVTVTTPSAILGIRGGIFTLLLPVPASLAASDPNLRGREGGELVINHFGTVTIRNGVSQVTLRPGEAVVIGSANQPISPPFKLAAAALTQITQMQTSGPGQHGGVAVGSIPASGFSGLPPGYSVGTLPPNRPGRPPGTGPLGSPSIFSNPGATSSQNSQIQSVRPPSYP